MIENLEEKCNFWQDGYLLVKNVFSANEMDIVKKKVINLNEMNERLSVVKKLQESNQHPSFSTIYVWNDTDSHNIFSKIGKSYKILDRMSYIFNQDVYCYHNKITLKYPGIVGFNPHQDYYYWSNYGVEFPDAHAAFVAIDDCTLENGCLQVIPESHLLGILPHDNWGNGESDNGVKKEVYNRLLEKGYKTVPILMNRGDVLFFHGNTIHLSENNNSTNSRIAMIVTLNTKRGSPLKNKNIGHPYYTKHNRVIDQITQKDLDLPNPDFTKQF